MAPRGRKRMFWCSRATFGGCTSHSSTPRT
ncbi:unnamed protein product [Linum tenue]|uniref:Uncharacterized protein n=1 Tax=Linum tenue TaxID=586396 RepID=A0AAV0JFK9_9ROSI|nr:unnamed protein product [Linum tenue]CAI0409181.1 unnamed protein product [Linum tenue]